MNIVAKNKQEFSFCVGHGRILKFYDNLIVGSPLFSTFMKCFEFFASEPKQTSKDFGDQQDKLLGERLMNKLDSMEVGNEIQRNIEEVQ
jgi:hypothetical protein